MEQRLFTKKQINAIQKRVENEFYNKGRKYSKQDVKEIFDGTNYPTEIVNKEISKELENDKYYNSGKKIKKPKLKKLKTKSLESSVMGEDLGKVGRGLGKVFRFITYPTIGVNFILPIMIRKAYEYDLKSMDREIPMAFSVIGALAESSIVYLNLVKFAPEAIPYVAGAQLATNLGSGIYEYIRSVKKRVKEKK